MKITTKFRWPWARGQESSAAQSISEACLAATASSIRDLSKAMRTLLRFEKKLLRYIEEYESLLTNTQKLIVKQETAIEALRSENKILGDVEVATLTEAMLFFKEQWKELSAMAIARQVASTKEG